MMIYLNGQFFVGNLSSVEGLPETAKPLAAALKDTVRHIAGERLKKTDWYTARFVETGVEIPAAIKAERQAIRDWCTAKEAELDTLEYSDLLKYDATK